MSKIRGIDGMVAVGASVLTTEPVYVGGKDCDGNAQPLPVCTKTPSEGSPAVFVAPRPISVFRDSFSSVINTINSNWDLISLGAGQTISQAGGNLIMTSGTSPNEEIIIRTKMSWEDAFVLRYLLTNSAYQANAKTTVEMVDVIGDNLSVTSSGTSISITKSNHGYTSENIGQLLFIGAFKDIVGGGTLVPGQYAIASITDVNTFVITGTGSSGTVTSGTCSVWGHNSLRVQYGATSTSTAYLNSTRRGWNSASESSVTTNTITSGSLGIWHVNDGIFTFNETTNNSASQNSARGVRTTGTPGADAELFLQIRLTVGTSAPTAITTTIGMISIEDTVGMQVEFANRGMASSNTSIPVNLVTSSILTNNIGSPSPTANGVNTFALINSANSTNLTSVKTSNTSISSIQLFNNGAAPAYFKVYNKSSAPTLASDTPIFIIGLGAGQSFSIGLTHHLRMNSGFAYAITGGAANNDATAVAANQVVGGVQYA